MTQAQPASVRPCVVRGHGGIMVGMRGRGRRTRRTGSRAGVRVGLPSAAAAGTEREAPRGGLRRSGRRRLHPRAEGHGDGQPAHVLHPGERRPRGPGRAERRAHDVLRMEGQRHVRGPAGGRPNRRPGGLGAIRSRPRGSRTCATTSRSIRAGWTPRTWTTSASGPSREASTVGGSPTTSSVRSRVSPGPRAGDHGGGPPPTERPQPDRLSARRGTLCSARPVTAVPTRYRARRRRTCCEPTVCGTRSRTWVRSPAAS